MEARQALTSSMHHLEERPMQWLSPQHACAPVRQRLCRALFLFVCCTLLPGLTLAAADPVEIQPEFWVTNGPVSTAVPSGDTLYIGGNFTYVGPLTGGAAAIDPVTGAPDLRGPRANSFVDSVVADGTGGWFIGG